MEEERAIVDSQELAHPIEALNAVATGDEIVKIQESVKGIYVDDLIRQYIVTVVAATRDQEDISLGSSPRGSLSLFRGAQALAMIRGRDYVLPDDVKELAVPMLAHRIIAAAPARMRGITPEEIIGSLVDQLAVPGAQSRGWFRT